MKLKVTIVLSVFTLFSCIKSNVGEVNFDNIALTPEYAFPVGQHTFYFNDFSKITNLQQVNDTLVPHIDSIIDTVFYYNNQYYYLPKEITTDQKQAFSFGDQNNLDIIEGFSVKTNVTSQIPGMLYVQVYFMQQEAILDSLYVSAFTINSPTVDNDGSIGPAKLSINETAFLDEARINKILNTDNLNIETRFTIPSFNMISVDYTDSLELGVQIAAKIKLKIPPNEN